MDIEKELKREEVIDIEHRTEKITFRLTPSELKIVEKRAKMAGDNLSGYVRYASLDKKIIVIEGLNEFLKEIRSISRNLNQLAILAHQGKISYINTDDLQKKLSAIIEMINSMR